MGQLTGEFAATPKALAVHNNKTSLRVCIMYLKFSADVGNCEQ